MRTTYVKPSRKPFWKSDEPLLVLLMALSLATVGMGLWKQKEFVDQLVKRDALVAHQAHAESAEGRLRADTRCITRPTPRGLVESLLPVLLRLKP